MKNVNTEKKAEDLILPIIEENKFELVDIEFVKEGPNWYLRVFIDKDEGITIDDCELVSKAFEKKLDEEDIIKQAYILEVSSPGIDRPLKKDKDFKRCIGKLIDIKLYKPFEGRKEFQGTLESFEDNIITIVEEDKKKFSFNKKDTASVRLSVIF